MNIQLIYIEFSVLLLNRFVNSAYVRKICILHLSTSKEMLFNGATLYLGVCYTCLKFCPQSLVGG